MRWQDGVLHLAVRYDHGPGFLVGKNLATIALRSQAESGAETVQLEGV